LSPLAFLKRFTEIGNVVGMFDVPEIVGMFRDDQTSPNNKANFYNV
jgi:hypothetical protein